jgi:hemoglobin
VTEPRQASLYEMIGGEPALIAVVDDFYDRVLDDEQLAGFFAGTSLTRLKGRQVEFFAQALGGPHAYRGATMRQAHQGRGIGYQHYNLVAGHLADALAGAGVADDHIKQVLATISPLADEIVTVR